MATTESSQMMALTLYSNPNQLHHLGPELFGGYYGAPILTDDAAYVRNPFLAPLELEDCFYSNASNATAMLPYYDPASQNEYVLTAAGDLECYDDPVPKRQRTWGSTQTPDFMLEPFEAPDAEYMHLPNEYYNMASENKGISAKKLRPSLSAQSIAARERRRKITEKTMELGKLIPGGRKMTTAEMLQAAHKYVKFLQAQVGLLQLIQPNDKEEEEEFPQDQPGIATLVGSPRIQEKLYSAEKCLATKELVRSVIKDNNVQIREKMLEEMEGPLNG